MTATYTDDQAAVDAREGRPGKPAAMEFVMTSATPELTSNPDVPQKWTGRAKLALFLGSAIGFWVLVAAVALWLIG